MSKGGYEELGQKVRSTKGVFTQFTYERYTSEKSLILKILCTFYYIRYKTNPIATRIHFDL